ncbi:MAG TPA: class I SAM-dependent rRNA methyltransferase [Gemmatimonadaceae bacterium]|nr:class I SAM-dependent rRNA methyltransferase [Gemmatimonadaceae bacterium]
MSHTMATASKLEQREALRAAVSARGAERWVAGHPWIYRSDLIDPPAAPAGAILVTDRGARPLGVALYSPQSEIALRLLDRDASASLDGAWWRTRLALALARRAPLTGHTNAYRVVHGEADGLPSLIVDRYDRWLVVQLLSAGLEAFRTPIVDALRELLAPDGILARNDTAVRTKEGLTRATELLHGDVPREIEVAEHGIRYLAAPWDGQKTGAFLDQRENRVLAGSVARGRALDCFAYHGSFALHLARNATSVTALDSSGPALARARENAARNGFTNIQTVQTDAFEFLRAEEHAGANYETIVLDPPAFAKTRHSLDAAIRGYKEINLRAMRLLSPGGMLFTASCSFHLSASLFRDMLRDAAADSGRRIAQREFRGQPLDHPEVLTIPESGYIKGALLEALD